MSYSIRQVVQAIGQHDPPWAERIDVGPGVMSTLAAAFPPPPDPHRTDGPCSAESRFAGLPIVETDRLLPGEWAIVDQDGNALYRGSLT